MEYICRVWGKQIKIIGWFLEMEKKKKSPRRLKFNTVQTVVIGFFGVILGGGILLSLPICNQKPIEFIDALFTSVSSVCVTGLVTIVPAEQFTLLGKIILLLLIQVGGLGVTSLGVGLMLVARKRVGIKSRMMVKEALNIESYKGIVKLVKSVLLMTLCFEAGGALLSFLVFSRDYSTVHAIGISIFHSIAAFNNSGFDILGGLRNLTPYQDDVLLNLTTCTLIIFGGLGFLVILDIGKQKCFKKLTLHSKVVIVTSLVLLVVGTLTLKLTENVTWLGAFFQSVSARTAGFSTYPIVFFENNLIRHCSLLVPLRDLPVEVSRRVHFLSCSRK